MQILKCDKSQRELSGGKQAIPASKSASEVCMWPALTQEQGRKVPSSAAGSSCSGLSAVATPIMLSRVTSLISCSSLQPSVPAGRAGITMYLCDSSSTQQQQQTACQFCSCTTGRCCSCSCLLPLPTYPKPYPLTQTHLRSAVESCTRMAVPSGSTVPNSASSPRGSRTARARYALQYRG